MEYDFDKSDEDPDRFLITTHRVLTPIEMDKIFEGLGITRDNLSSGGIVRDTEYLVRMSNFWRSGGRNYCWVSIDPSLSEPVCAILDSFPKEIHLSSSR